MSLTAGQQLLHYRLVSPLGEGGMGVVWRALDTSLGPAETRCQPIRVNRLDQGRPQSTVTI